MMKKVPTQMLTKSTPLTLALICMCLVSSADAAIIVGEQLDGALGDIVGTNLGGGNPATPEVNAVIAAYNAARDPDLPTITTGGSIGKWEDAGFVDGVLSVNLFTFYAVADGVATNNTVNTGTLFGSVLPDLVLVDPLDLGDPERRVIAFEFNGPDAAFQYYISKNSNDFTVWSHVPGEINPIYIELTPGDNLFEPGANAVSHFEFYNITTRTPSIPEPSSALLLVLGAIGVAGFRFTRRRRSA
jgi:hypothetical protein